MERDLRIFVYGTLRRGERNHHWMKGACWLGRHVTEPLFTMYHLGDYPAVVSGGRTAILGEVYAARGTDLSRLDRLEDYPRLYLRETIITSYGQAWIYVMPHPPRRCRIIDHGDWAKRRF